MSSYSRDGDGYVIISFGNEIKRKKEKKHKKKKEKGIKSILSLDLPEEFLARIKNKELTKDYLITLPLDVVLRAGWYDKYTREALSTHLDLNPIPLKTKYEVRPHQHEILCFMKDREKAISSYNTHGIKGGILHCQMGLGKTLTALVHTLSSPKKKYPDEPYGENGYPILVIASKTVMQEWILQIRKFFGSEIKFLCAHKDYLGKKGMDSLTWSKPQIQVTNLSSPNPNPLWGTEPYFLRSRYQLKASKGRLCSLILFTRVS